MVKVSCNAGHGGFGVTPGKRSPDGEYEWDFNNKITIAFINELKKHGVQVLRCDDPTGKTDVSLKTRVARSDSFKADLHVSIHNNALAGKWGNHGGTETLVGTKASASSKRCAAIVQRHLLKATGLRDRKVKVANLYEMNNVNCPSVLIEAAFMDSITDIKVLRDDNKLKEIGIAIAHGVLEYFGIEVKTTQSASVTPKPKESPQTKQEEDEMFDPKSQSLMNEVRILLSRLVEKDPNGFSPIWIEKFDQRELTNSEMIALIAIALKRGLLKD